ncbi:MAG TPA: RNA polymerase sigma-54 factor, partial [Alcanivorax sp.]|nr:RNA polymerase sigma-54 factor [Alcanivorax sp.]
HDYAGLRRALGATEEALLAAMALLRGLDPAPGQQIGGESADYAVPDVVVSAHKGGWRVALNEAVLPRVNLHAQYAQMARQVGGEDGQYLRNCMQEAKWFLKSLQSRHDTLLKVASRIVEVQQDFFNYGEEAMKPLVLADIAEAVGMHESTISRVTNQKFMLTPKGVFELKYFFSSHVDTDGGGECSSTAIRAIIKKLVAAESPRKPLSDNKLASLLNDQGIKVARRTVAKYREAMRIPSSSARKRLV